MAALIVMDAGGGPAVGTTTLPGSGVNTPVLCTNFDDTGVLAWKWELIDVPEPSVTYNPIPPPTLLSSVTITPDVKGHTILIRLTTYSDLSAAVIDGVDQKAIRVRFDPPYDWIIPAAHEKIEGDALRGWAVEVNELLRDVRAFMASPPGLQILTNVSGGTMTRGQAARVQADLTVVLAQANGLPESQFVAAVFDASIADTAEGLLQHGGVITVPTGLQLDGPWNASATIYLSDITAGSYTRVPPTAQASFVARVGRCLNIPGGGDAFVLIEKSPPEVIGDFAI